MQRWEYCIIDGGWGYSLKLPSLSGWENIKIKRDKSQGDQNDFDAFARTIAQLGLDGWELVTQEKCTEQQTWLWFKRPMPESVTGTR